MNLRKSHIAYFRFYEELNDFLSDNVKKKLFPYHFNGTPSIKDAIEALGVPHTEIDLILVNNNPVDFNYLLQPGDRISVFPIFETFDITKLTKIRKKPLRKIKFILDVHLGKLTKYLRMLGFDSFYRNDLSDDEIIHLGLQQNRIILTRDILLLKNKTITHGYWLRETDPILQLIEVIHRFDLTNKIKAFSRCMQCNGIIKTIKKNVVQANLPRKTKKYFHEFYQCNTCHKVYWPGSHYENMVAKIKLIKGLCNRYN